jgi:hypothetical protein
MCLDPFGSLKLAPFVVAAPSFFQILGNTAGLALISRIIQLICLFGKRGSEVAFQTLTNDGDLFARAARRLFQLLNPF